MRPGNDVALELLERRLRLFQGELLITARLLKHLPAGCAATKSAARRHSFDIGSKQPLRSLEVVRRHSLDEPTCASELHRPNLTGLRQRAAQGASSSGSHSPLPRYLAELCDGGRSGRLVVGRPPPFREPESASAVSTALSSCFGGGSTGTHRGGMARQPARERLDPPPLHGKCPGGRDRRRGRMRRGISWCRSTGQSVSGAVRSRPPLHWSRVDAARRSCGGGACASAGTPIRAAVLRSRSERSCASTGL